MDKKLAQYFFDATREIFSFLTKEYSFLEPQFEIDEKINFAYTIFMAKNLAIEFILDERESDVDCKISRVVDGKKTSFFTVDKRGVRVREALHSLLARRSVREGLFTRVAELNILDRINVTLTDFSKMLQKYGQDILNDSPKALD